jgi:Mn-dependent DtxR family transcriptional regulator
MNRQHVQVPNMNLKEESLDLIDPYVYACIKRYMNNTTKEAFPSLETILKDTGLANYTVLKSIKRLSNANYLRTEKKKGTSTRYIFNDYKKFEIFSFDFLDNTELTPKEKAYLITIQNKMYKDNVLEIGKITLSNTDIKEVLNIDPKTMRKLEQSLQEKKVLQLIPIKTKDERGVSVNERIYSFTDFANLVALKFSETDSQIQELNKQQADIKKQFELMQEEINRLKKMMRGEVSDAEIIL